MAALRLVLIHCYHSPLEGHLKHTNSNSLRGVFCLWVTLKAKAVNRRALIIEETVMTDQNRAN